MLFPSLPTAVQAEESGSTANLNVEPAVAITLPDTVAIDVTPTPDGTFAYSNVNLSVSTNNNSGYALHFATTGDDNHLHSQNQATTETIAPVSGSVTQATFANNTWGYNLRAASEGDANARTEYQAVPESGDTAQRTTSAPSSDSYNLTFGAKVNTSIPSGTYTNTVAVSVVANPPLVTDMTSLSTMQEMTPEVCEKTEVGTVARLIDARGEPQKQYWVAKLADGNCWMTQNLDLDLSTSKALTPADSDVSRSWTPGNDTLTDGTKTTSDPTAEWSWNLGDYVLTTPNAGTSCGPSGKSDFGDCTSVGFQSVVGMTPMADGNATDVISGNTYNAHYHVGNHYTWNAATAGTGGADVVGEDATDSICPKGWQLPTSNNSSPGSFQALTNAYSISSNAAGSTALVSAPLYFMRSGYVFSGSLRRAGDYGYYWSSTAYSDTNRAYRLYFYSGYVRPSNVDARYGGQSVRCLASQ